MDGTAELLDIDRRYLVHPLHHPEEHKAPLLVTEGKGAMLHLADGRVVIDGLAGLWNVNVGHGRGELADAAAGQMRKIAYASAYVGATNEPAIRLGEKIVKHAYSNSSAIYYTTGGAESNESAFKTARFFWKVQDKPDKTKVISRTHGYHGVTMAAMSATGMAAYHKMFGPLMPGFIQVAAPYPYRWQGNQECGIGAAEAVEKAMLAEGPETVAAVIAEPVMGAGGVIVPPESYFPKLRQICDQYDVLLIADEVITGFGRTGRWFSLGHWGVEPDIVSFAKGVTSGYLPLSGVVVSRAVHDTLKLQKGLFSHGFTYSGHPVACAVALANLGIIEREGLVERAAELGARLAERLRGLLEEPMVGHVRSLGLIGGVELVKDRETKESYDAGLTVARRVYLTALADGVILRPLPGDVVGICPPLTISEQELDQVMDTLRRAIATVARDLHV